MSPVLSIADAAATLRRGGIVACPTESVWGLSCDPFDEAAVLRLLAIKQRPVDKGLILVAATPAQLDAIADWSALPPGREMEVRTSWPGPNTWIVPTTPRVPRWISGDHDSVAVRVTAHPVASGLCQAFGGVLVSTSANRAGMPPPRTAGALDPGLLAAIDGRLQGETGARDRPSDIRDARTGALLRG